MATPLVSICSVTYNHAPYIRQCLDGLVIQKTNFPYGILIHDDSQQMEGRKSLKNMHKDIQIKWLRYRKTKTNTRKSPAYCFVCCSPKCAKNILLLMTAMIIGQMKINYKCRQIFWKNILNMECAIRQQRNSSKQKINLPMTRQENYLSILQIY